MSHDVVLIPCEICNKSVAFDDYQSHQAQHTAEQTAAATAAYNKGNMYGPIGPVAPVDPLAGGIGPLPKPQGYQDPHPTSQITIDDYVIENVEGTNKPDPEPYD